MIEFFPTKLILKSLGALPPFSPFPPWNMNVKLQGGSHVITMTYKATCRGQGSGTPGELCDTEDFLEPLCQQLPLQQPNLSS